jgi:hypothetical protein
MRSCARARMRSERARASVAVDAVTIPGAVVSLESGVVVVV